jgi:CheY-like chemotaxis protein
VTLPTQAGSPAPAAPETEVDERRDALVLVVEDDPHLLLGLQELLEIYDGRYRLHVITAENGREGLEVLAGHHPDLIVSDIMMPEMGGYEFLQNVRQNPEWVRIPFIFLTARGERKDIHRGRRSGVEEYITKPYDSDELLELVVTQLDRHFQVQGVMDRDLEELKRSILQLITPDFRLPLSKVTEFSERLVESLEGAQTGADLKESLQGIQAGSVRLSRLVEDFITLAEIRTGEAASAIALRGRPLPDVGVLLYEAAQGKQPLAAENDVVVECPLNADLPPVFGDAVLLLRALERFVEIGVRACAGEDGCAVSLNAAAAEETVAVTMALPIATPPSWQAFWNGKEEALEQVDAGVLIVRGYVDLHDGRVRLQSDADYTVVSLHFPIYRPPQTP